MDDKARRTGMNATYPPDARPSRTGSAILIALAAATSVAAVLLLYGRVGQTPASLTDMGAVRFGCGYDRRSPTADGRRRPAYIAIEGEVPDEPLAKRQPTHRWSWKVRSVAAASRWTTETGDRPAGATPQSLGPETFIYTDYPITVARVLRGKAVGDTVVVRLRGGQVGEDVVVDRTEADLKPGEKVLLLLRPDDMSRDVGGAHYVVSWGELADLVRIVKSDPIGTYGERDRRRLHPDAVAVGACRYSRSACRPIVGRSSALAPPLCRRWAITAWRGLCSPMRMAPMVKDVRARVGWNAAAASPTTRDILERCAP
ncbi:MAG: hypothetical protein WKH64_02310 [Chloroflexia bacterium]